jgi:glutamate mutase epsilon subunit
MIVILILLSSYNVLRNNLQVWVLEELELPISISSEANRKKVLMKSPWEIIKKPTGSGGIFSLLSSNKILDSLNEMGVQYIQVRSSAGHLTFLIIHIIAFTDHSELRRMN